MRINNGSLRMGLFLAFSLFYVTGIGGGDGIAVHMQNAGRVGYAASGRGRRS